MLHFKGLIFLEGGIFVTLSDPSVKNVTLFFLMKASLSPSPESPAVQSQIKGKQKGDWNGDDAI